MTFVRVAIPVKKGKRRFHLEKGRPWSLIEHVVLYSICESAQSVDKLAERSALPRRLVLECVIRLMKAGWVELSQVKAELVFKSTLRGSEVVKGDELPNLAKKTSRWVSFIIDQITGTLYRNREFVYYEKHVIREKSQNEPIIKLNSSADFSIVHPDAILDTLLEDDEKFVSTDASVERLQERLALVTVRNEVIDGLPERAPDKLGKYILEAARNYSKKSSDPQSRKYFIQPSIEADRPIDRRLIETTFRMNDLICDGTKHKEIFENAIDKARERIIIHSTFINKSKFDAIYPKLNQARNRGVRIDVLWGEDEDKSSKYSSSREASEIRNELALTDSESGIFVHNFSTNSHAKILIADDGGGKYFAVVGSCNWLSSNFDSFEVSIRLRGAVAVAQVLDKLADMSTGRFGHWNSLTNDLTRMSAELRTIKEVKSGPTAKIALALGPDHGQFVREARDHAQNNMFVTSHRLGAANHTVVIVPALAAVLAKGISVNLYYGRISDDVTNTIAADVQRHASEQNIALQPISEPRLHGKVLSWDDDNIVVTSQNWLSADPSESNYLKEIGVYVEYSNIAKRLREEFELARSGY